MIVSDDEGGDLQLGLPNLFIRAEDPVDSVTSTVNFYYFPISLGVVSVVGFYFFYCNVAVDLRNPVAMTQH